MSLLTFYVNVSVTLEGVRVTATPLGVPMFLVDHSATVNRADLYGSIAELEADGHVAADEAHKWATTLLSQDLTPDEFIIGRIDVGDANITASINAVQAANDDFYFVNIESRLDADITEIALWTEAEKKVFIPQSDEAAILVTGGADIASTLQGLSYDRTGLLYHALDAEYADAAFTGRCGAADLDAAGGVLTWANKSLSGVTVNDLTVSEIGFVRSKGANGYHKVTSVNNLTTPGQAAGGQFLDITTSLDWTFFRSSEQIFAALIGASTKVPYTQAGIDLLGAALQTVLDRGVSTGHFTGDPGFAPTVTVPAIADVSASDKTNRILRDIQGVATLAGAVHQVIVNVSVSQ